MLRRCFVPSTTSSSSFSTKKSTFVINAAALTSSYRFYLPGTKDGVINSHLPSVMPKIKAETSLWSQYTKAAKKFGDKTAFVCGVTGATRSFKQGLERTQLYARTMQHGMGIVREDVIIVLSPNCLDYPCVFYAAMAIGATICPVNPLCTPEELKRTITSAGRVKAIFTQAPFTVTVATALGLLQADKPADITKNLSQGSDAPLPQTFIFSDTLDLPDNLPNFKESIHKLDDTAVLPFSSGTTGLAKGVQLTNYSIISNIFQTEQSFNLSHDEIFMSVLPFFHIYGMVVCMMMGWVHGSLQVVLPKFDLELYIKRSLEHKPTHLFVAPPMFLGFLKAPFPNKKDAFSSVTRVISGAAPLGEQLQHQAESLFSPSCVISQGYGMSEASPVVTVSNPKVEGIRHELKKYGHVGGPAADTEIRVVDPETGKDVDEFGQPGEMWIRGPQIMKGYLRQEDTDKVLTADRWYKSGDICVVNKDFTFTITDRVKEMIKVGGMQIAPAEIEALLQSHPKINEAVVVGLPSNDGSGTELPYAQVALKPEIQAEISADVVKKEALVEELKKFVHDHLSYYKQLKGGVDFVAAVPKSPTGKLLRRIARDQKIAELKSQNKK